MWPRRDAGRAGPRVPSRGQGWGAPRAAERRRPPPLPAAASRPPAPGPPHGAAAQTAGSGRRAADAPALTGQLPAGRSARAVTLGTRRARGWRGGPGVGTPGGAGPGAGRSGGRRALGAGAGPRALRVRQDRKCHAEPSRGSLRAATDLSDARAFGVKVPIPFQSESLSRPQRLRAGANGVSHCI